jgi:hypothetical protein
MEGRGAPTGRALFIGSTNDQLTDALLRLARLLDTPQDIPLLAPMVIREIYYRLLNGLYGRRIAQMAIDGTNMQRIAHVIQILKTKFSDPSLPASRSGAIALQNIWNAISMTSFDGRASWRLLRSSAGTISRNCFGSRDFSAGCCVISASGLIIDDEAVWCALRPQPHVRSAGSA